MEEAYRFLNGLSIVRMKNVAKISQCGSEKYSEELRKIAKKREYIDLYQHAIAFNEYDILMKDFSFFQFSFDGDTNIIRMSYYPNPDIITTYEQYIKYLSDKMTILDGEEWRYREEYENYIDNQESNNMVTPLRYDYSEKEYQGLIHSAAHFHFGQMETVRVTCEKVLSPLSFAVMVVNYYYYPIWKEKLKQDEKFKKIVLSVKEQCDIVNEEYLSHEEQKYFLIS